MTLKCVYVFFQFLNGKWWEENTNRSARLEDNPRSNDENQQTQPTHDTEIWYSYLGHIVARAVLSQLDSFAASLIAMAIAIRVIARDAPLIAMANSCYSKTSCTNIDKCNIVC